MPPSSKSDSRKFSSSSTSSSPSTTTTLRTLTILFLTQMLSIPLLFLFIILPARTALAQLDPFNSRTDAAARVGGNPNSKFPIYYRRYEVPEGQPVRILCTIHDYDTPTADSDTAAAVSKEEIVDKFEGWEQADGTPIKGTGESGMFTVGNILTIREVKPAHAGIYFCRSSRGRRAFVLTPLPPTTPSGQHQHQKSTPNNANTIIIVHDILRLDRPGELVCPLATPWRWLRNGTALVSDADSNPNTATYRIIRSGLFQAPTTLHLSSASATSAAERTTFACQTASATVQVEFRVRVVPPSDYRLLDTSKSKQPPMYSDDDVRIHVPPSSKNRANDLNSQSPSGDSVYERSVADEQRNSNNMNNNNNMMARDQAAVAATDSAVGGPTSCVAKFSVFLLAALTVKSFLVLIMGFRY